MIWNRKKKVVALLFFAGIIFLIVYCGIGLFTGTVLPESQELLSEIRNDPPSTWENWLDEIGLRQPHKKLWWDEIDAKLVELGKLAVETLDEKDKSDPVLIMLERIKKPEPAARLSAIAALRYLDDLRGVWPLTEMAVHDKDPDIRRIAAWVATGFGKEAKEPEIIKRRSASTLMNFPYSHDWQGYRFASLAEILIDWLGIPVAIDWCSLEKIRNDLMNIEFDLKTETITFAEFYCHLAVTVFPDGGVGFDYGKISRITSIDKLRPSLITQKCQSFRDNLKKKYNDTHGETKVLEKLKHPYKKSLYFASTFSEELTLLQNELQTNVEVDWASLEKAGYKNDFYVDYQFAASHYFKMNQIKVNLFDMLDLVLNDFGAGKAKLDYVIEGDTIFVSTEEEINRRIGFDPRAELKKLKEGKDENTQSIPATQKQ